MRAERPVKGLIFADEWIEFWGRVYDAVPALRSRGVLFETFLIAPREVLAALGQPVCIAHVRGDLVVAAGRLERAVCELAREATVTLERCEGARG